MTELAKVNETDAMPIDPMVSMIERMIMAPDVPVDKITALLDMRERQMNKEAEQAFNAAFAAAMAEMPDVPRSGKNKHSGQVYSKLEDLIRTTRAILSGHGLSLNWQSQITGNEVTVTAFVRHSLGHQISTTLSGPKDNGKQMNALQGGGSAETYLKRYTGFAILGLASGDEIDNDGIQSSAATISADQFLELQDMIERAGLPEKVVLDAERIDSLEAMPAAKFAGVKSNLQANIRKKESAQ